MRGRGEVNTHRVQHRGDGHRNNGGAQQEGPSERIPGGPADADGDEDRDEGPSQHHAQRDLAGAGVRVDSLAGCRPTEAVLLETSEQSALGSGKPHAMLSAALAREPAIASGDGARTPRVSYRP